MKKTVNLAKLVIMAITLLGFAPVTGHALTSEPLLWWQLRQPGQYINGYNDPQRNIWEVRNEAELLRQRLGHPKHLVLHWGLFPGDNQATGAVDLARQAQAWLRQPDGSLSEIPLTARAETVEVTVPDANAPEGLYLLGSRYAAGRHDIDGDGKTEEVYLYGTFLLRHVRESLSHGGERQTFMQVPAIPLEIGPVRAGRYSGIIQISHRPYEMAVYYRGQPLADAEVVMLTDRGWHKSVRTNAQGQFVAVPHESHDTERDWETYLYVVRYHDRQRNEYHCATIPMLVDSPWPEWSYYMTSFVLWSFVGTAFAVLLTGVLIVRYRRRQNLRMARFNTADRPGRLPCE